MKVLKNKELSNAKWAELINNNPFSSPFQTPEYYNFFNSLEGFSADVFAVEANDEYQALVVVTVLKGKGLKGYFSRRGIIYAGPLVSSNNHNALGFLLKSVSNYYSHKLIYLETRNCFDYAAFKKQFDEQGFNYLPWLNYHLHTSDLASM